MTFTNSQDVVALIADIFERRGADSYLGEEVTMSQHMLQAALLAEQAGADEVTIAAALLHDIGHYTNEFPEDALETGTDNYHEEAGARILRKWFPPKLVDCVRYHVPAKRYLCATRETYHQSLSAASKHSLQLQGGRMNPEEVAAFKQHQHLDDILQVRIWDDLAKYPETVTPPFSHYVPILNRLVNRAISGRD
ncbi:MAG: HD domain-containing protein [Acidiferrobacterales bacterium]|nr:HD domain-containing protein [Acidiferrobacterales bacterium]